jgi:hypothetical protein
MGGATAGAAAGCGAKNLRRNARPLDPFQQKNKCAADRERGTALRNMN